MPVPSKAVLDSGQTLSQEDKVICCECGSAFHQLSVHISGRHKMNVAQYQQKWPGAPTISAWASKNVSDGQKKPREAEPTAEPGVKSGIQPKEILKIGAAMVPVWVGWPEADQALVPAHDKYYQIDVEFIGQIALAFELMENVMITGPTGVGKTTALCELATILNWPVTRINLNGETRVADLIGDMEVLLDEATGQAITSWKDGPLITAMRRGHVCIVDEIDAAPPAIHFVMQRVTERDPDPAAAIAAGRAHVQLLLPTGECVKAHPNFRLASTANTVGTGDSTGDYAATHPLNRAFLSRWGVKLRVGYPKSDVWAGILVGKTGIQQLKAIQIVNVAEKINEAKAKMLCRINLGPRETLVWARLFARLGDMALSMRMAVVNGIEQQDPDHQFALDVLKQVVGIS